MSAHISPYIPRLGLICALDPMNPRCNTTGSGLLTDLTGNGNNITNANANSSSITSYNGVTVLRITSGSTHTIQNLSVSIPYTVVVIARYNGLNTNLKGRTIQSNTVNWVTGMYGGEVAFYAGGTAGFVSQGAFNPAGTDWYCTIADCQLGTGSYYINGINRTTSPVSASAIPGPIIIGSSSIAPNERSDADIGLILVYNRALSIREKDMIFHSHRSRYNIR